MHCFQFSVLLILFGRVNVWTRHFFRWAPCARHQNHRKSICHWLQAKNQRWRLKMCASMWTESFCCKRANFQPKPTWKIKIRSVFFLLFTNFSIFLFDVDFCEIHSTSIQVKWQKDQSVHFPHTCCGWTTTVNQSNAKIQASKSQKSPNAEVNSGEDWRTRA